MHSITNPKNGSKDGVSNSREMPTECKIVLQEEINVVAFTTKSKLIFLCFDPVGEFKNFLILIKIC